MPHPTHWSDNFFDGPWNKLHTSFRRPIDTEREVDAVIAILNLPVGSSIADVPCGPGDHTIELARRGFHSTGIDRSGSLLEHARARATSRGVEPSFIEFIHGDMRSIRFDQRFDAVICMWGSFGYFDSPGDHEQIHTFRHLLKPGGLVLIDLLPLEGILMHFEPRSSHRVGPMLVVQDRSYDVRTQHIDSVWTFHEDGDRTVRRTSMRLYSVREVVELLEAVGFVDVRVMEPETRQPFAFGDVRAWVRAIKA